MIARRWLFVAALCAVPFAQAHSATGLLKSERTSGLNKTCLYEVLGSPYTVNVEAREICPLTIDVPNPPTAPPVGARQRQTGLFLREQTSGLNKICYYAVLGSARTLTVSSISLCPASYQFE
jgi:hypothetical protein